MAFQLTYNGKTLRLPDAQTLALLEAIYPFAYGTDEVLRQAKVGGRLAKLSPPQFYNPRIGLNQWWYPTGALRFSILRCVAAMADVEWFAASAWGEGALVPRPLVMRSDGDSTDTGFQTDMFLLPPRPVADLSTSGADNQFAGGTGSELYWLTFVDERYFWQNSSSLDQRDTGGDWSEVITDLIYTLYEGTFTFDEAVESVYGQPEPDSALYSSNENAAVLIDVMLANIGRYLVRNLDGTYTAIRYNTGINTYEASLRPFVHQTAGRRCGPFHVHRNRRPAESRCGSCALRGQLSAVHRELRLSGAEHVPAFHQGQLWSGLHDPTGNVFLAFPLFRHADLLGNQRLLAIADPDHCQGAGDYLRQHAPEQPDRLPGTGSTTGDGLDRFAMSFPG